MFSSFWVGQFTHISFLLSNNKIFQLVYIINRTTVSIYQYNTKPLDAN